MMKKILVFLTAFTVAGTIHGQAYTTLGIGTNSPAGTLHVHSAQAVEPDEPGNGLHNRDYFQDDYLTVLRITNTNTGATENDGFSFSQYNYDLTFKQHENGLVLLQNNNGMVTMTRGGGFSIGDSVTAGYKLDVNGTSRLRGNTLVSGNINATGGAQLGSGFSVSTTGDMVVGGSVQMGTGFSLSSTGNMTVSGDVTLGSGFYCDSQGNAKVKSLRVTLTDWPDFVFTDKYPLMPLNELRSYIIDNGHLPQVPSAATVDEDGVDVGEMNKVLLQKVEELTLYIIDLQKQIDELKKDN